MKLTIDNVIYSKDKVSKKFVYLTEDDHQVETLYVDYSNKHIICFSTQIGCNLKCQFCYNGLKNNFIRNLTLDELVSEIDGVINYNKDLTDKPILFSAMGIGEPLLNYDNLVKLFYYLQDKYPGSKFALATTGVNLNNILKLKDDLKGIENFKLTISLHASNDEIRNKIIPVNKNIHELVTTVKRYKELSGREVEWNYLILDGVNDSNEDAYALCNLLGKDEYIKVNHFNKVDISEYKESLRLSDFINELKSLGMQVEYYETNGGDIDGACGQMIAK